MAHLALSLAGLCAAACRGALGLDARCQACGSLGQAHCCGPLRGLVLCAACVAALAPRLGGFCPACGELHADPAAPPHLCGPCLADRPPWGNLYFHGPYHGRLGDLLLEFKFGAALHRQKLLMDLAWRAYARNCDGPAPDLLAPVPLTPARLAWRGFNQSLELCRRLAAELGRPALPAALRRTRETIPQARLDKARRAVNLRGAFAADADAVAGRTVLLVDDVCTTGATLRECAAALHVAGAAGVEVLFLARA